MPPVKEPVKNSSIEENKQAIVGLKSICSNLESLSKQLNEKIKLEEDRHKATCTSINNIQTKIDTVLVQIVEVEKKIYQIEFN